MARRGRRLRVRRLGLRRQAPHLERPLYHLHPLLELDHELLPLEQRPARLLERRRARLRLLRQPPIRP
jgi:hypothetical protein